MSATIAIGRRQPASQLLATLRLDECQPPCWIGIIPGTTTIDEAQLIVVERFRDQATIAVNSDRLNPIALDITLKIPEPIHILIVRDVMSIRQNWLVRAIDFIFTDPDSAWLNVGQLFAVTRTPAYVRVFRDFGKHSITAWFSWGEPDYLTSAVIVAHTRLDSTGQIRLLRFSSPNSRAQSMSDWKGFATLTHYTRTP
jgi:hypothetical protein